MKTLNNYINETLYCSQSEQINEWRYNSNSEIKHFTIVKDNDDLKAIIRKRIKENPEEPYLLDIDVSNLEKLHMLFDRSSTIKRIDISTWNTSNIKLFVDMFYSCKSLEYVNMNNLKFDSCISVSGMFSGCENLKIIKGISTWKFPKTLVTARYMFKDCKSLSSKIANDINQIDIVNHRYCDIDYMFKDANKSIIPKWYDINYNSWK